MSCYYPRNSVIVDISCPMAGCSELAAELGTAVLQLLLAR